MPKSKWHFHHEQQPIHCSLRHHLTNYRTTSSNNYEKAWACPAVKPSLKVQDSPTLILLRTTCLMPFCHCIFVCLFCLIENHHLAYASQVLLLIPIVLLTTGATIAFAATVLLMLLAAGWVIGALEQGTESSFGAGGRKRVWAVRLGRSWIGRGGKREPETNRPAPPFHLPTLLHILFYTFWPFLVWSIEGSTCQTFIWLVKEIKNGEEDSLSSSFPPFPS